SPLLACLREINDRRKMICNMCLVLIIIQKIVYEVICIATIVQPQKQFYFELGINYFIIKTYSKYW
ncbi:hypothetical protein HHI36_008336, partial [Cryptolaemus montrouzieri]